MLEPLATLDSARYVSSTEYLNTLDKQHHPTMEDLANLNSDEDDDLGASAPRLASGIRSLSSRKTLNVVESDEELQPVRAAAVKQLPKSTVKYVTKPRPDQEFTTVMWQRLDKETKECYSDAQFASLKASVVESIRQDQLTRMQATIPFPYRAIGRLIRQWDHRHLVVHCRSISGRFLSRY